MSRLSYAQLDKIKEHYGVDRIWSHSRINTYVSQPWLYRITYLDKLKPDTSNVYNYFGTILHDLAQGVYTGEHEIKELPSLYEQKVIDWRLGDSGFKFMNENVEKGYLNNIEHYFENFKKLPYEVIVEKPVKIVLGDDKEKEVFVGYVDGLYKDEEGNMVILDFKSSSKGEYSGKKLKESSRQLLLYSIGIHQATGLPYEKIKARFDMMKYMYVEFLQKNGKWRGSLQERVGWVKAQEKRMVAALSETDMDVFDIDYLVKEAIGKNSMEDLPQEIQDRFRVSPGFIDVDVSEENAKELEEWLLSNISELRTKEAGDWEVEFPEPVIDPSNEFYFNVLAKGALKFHKGHQEEQAMKGARVQDQTIDFDSLEALFI